MAQNNLNETNEMDTLQDALQNEMRGDDNGNKFIKLSDALFKPLIHASSLVSGLNMAFDNIYIPFKIVDNRVYYIQFTDFCEERLMIAMEVEKEGEDAKYINCDVMIKEGLCIQHEIGIEYYFGKLNKVVRNYATALKVLLEKKYITMEEYTKLYEDIF